MVWLLKQALRELNRDALTANFAVKTDQVLLGLDFLDAPLPPGTIQPAGQHARRAPGQRGVGHARRPQQCLFRDNADTCADANQSSR